VCKIADVAHLLAAREAKLQARIDDLQERSARRLDDSTAIDALVYAVACLELQPGSERDRAVREALNRVIDHVGAIEVRAKEGATKLVSTLVAGAKAREEALAKCVAELEANDKSNLLHLGELSHAYTALQHREAAHLAHIKALRGDLAAMCISERDHGAWHQAKGTLADTAHYDVEGEVKP
jgi:hypothetical protein